MSRLSDLIAELCPNGVEYQPLEPVQYLFSMRRRNARFITLAVKS